MMHVLDPAPRIVSCAHRAARLYWWMRTEEGDNEMSNCVPNGDAHGHEALRFQAWVHRQVGAAMPLRFAAGDLFAAIGKCDHLHVHLHRLSIQCLV